MTTSQMILITSLYLAALVAVAYLTRAEVRRIEGAVAGGAVFGVVALLAVALGEARSWWRVPKANSSHFQLPFWLSFSVSCVPVYLITWRIARRFGGRGLAVCVLAAAIMGPPRDYWFAATFPAWMVFSAGIAPVLADATIYALLVVVGHTVMRLFVGPAQGDSLARRRSGEEKNGTADTSARAHADPMNRLRPPRPLGCAVAVQQVTSLRRMRNLPRRITVGTQPSVRNGNDAPAQRTGIPGNPEAIHGWASGKPIMSTAVLA